MVRNLEIGNVQVNGTSVDTSPFSVLAGDILGVGWTVTNAGDELIPGVGSSSTTSVNIDAVYLSDDDIFDVRDTLVGGYTNNSSVVAGGSYNGSTSFRLFPNAPGSQYPLNRYLIFVTNTTGSVAESDQQDNIALVPITINSIDLSLDFATVAVGSPPQVFESVPPLAAFGIGYGSPVDIVAGRYIDVSWNVSNLGNQSAGDHIDRVYLSQNAVLDENDFLVAQNQVSSSSNTYNFNVSSVNIPINTGISGQAYVLFVTDATNQITESDESNNVYATPVNISTESADLAFSSVTVPADINAGQPISVSWTVENIGTDATSGNGWYDRVYLSDDTILGAEDLEVGGRYNSPNLIPGGSYTQADVLLNNLPANAIGTKYLLFATDTDGFVGGGFAPTATPPLGSTTLPSNGFVLERNENNNVAFQEIIIKAADLVPSSVVSSTPTVEYGTAFNVTWTTNNAGNGNTFGASSHQLFLSLDSIAGNSDDILISTGTDVASIAGAVYTQTVAVTINSGSTLSNPLLTDVDGYVLEVETNNTRETANDLQQNFVLDTAANSYIVRAKGVVETSGGGDYYRIFASPGDTLTINQNASLSVNGTPAIGDSYLYLYNRDGLLLGANDDSGGTLNSFIQYTLPTTAYIGEYYIRAAGYRSSVGGYGLTVQQQTTSPLIGIGGNGVAPGDYYLVAKVDSGNAIRESNESNNFAVSTSRINIAAPANSPDLTIVGSSPTTASFGSIIPISWTVTNSSSNPAQSGWFDYVYLSDDNIIGAGDTVVASFARGVNEPVLAAGESYTVNRNITLPTGVLGNKFLLFATDRANNRLEANETNNLNTAAIQLVAPDLSISSITTPQEGISGQPISVSWTVNNQGTGNANGTWTDYIYASNDNVIGNDIFLGAYSYTGNIAAGSSIARTENVLLPSVFNASYRLVVRADSSSQLPESNEANNNSISTDAIQVTAPDLLVSAITTLQETISGQPLNVSWTISNQGTSAANGTWTDYIYASSDDVIGGNDLFLGAYTTSTNIGVGSSITRSENISLPLDFAGSYRLVVRTDLNSQLSEINESNNNSIDDQAILVRLAPIPNLTVASITPPATAFSSQSTVVTWSVTNTGTGATTVPNWYDSVYLSLDSIIDDTDRLLGYAINPSYLDVNGSYTNSLTITLPQGISGNYRFLVRTDAFNNLNELSGENDNIGVSSITAVTLTPPPDLQVVAVNAPSGALSGQPINLSWTVANQGEGRTLETFWSDRIFMSQDAILDASDRFLGDVAHTGALVSGASYTSTASFALPIGVAGDFYFFVRSDVGNQVYENIYESNNVGLDSTPTTITLTPPPDLEFESLVLPTNARSGETLNISYRVTNFGATETPNGSWSDAFYLSTDDQFNAATDILLGSVGHYGILNPEQGYNGAASFNLSNSLTGTYYLFGIADNGDGVFELDNTNNLTKSTNQVQIVSRPADLIVTNTVVPTAGEAGKTVQVQWTVKNQGIGNSITTSWTDRITASIDATLGNSDDVVLGDFSHNGLLAVNASYSRTENITIPFALEGSYQLFVTTDTGNEVYESINENNNSSTASPIAINRQTPDLQVTAITASSDAASGQPLSLSWTVANLGAGKTNINYWYDSFYLSTDTTISANDISLGSVYHAGELEANATYNASATFTLPIDLTGTYNLLVRTDSNNYVLEGALESNNDRANVSSTTIALSAVPDLVVQSVDAPAQGIAGQSISLTWTIANNGANASQNWYDAVYLSQDQVFNRNSDIYLGYQQRPSTLNTNGTYTTTRSFDLPRGLGGRYFAFVVADSGNQVYERANENNNFNYDGLSTEIITPPPSDLVVTNVTVPANGVLGQTASIGYTVTNQGTDTAYGTWSDALYLSTDTQWDINDQAIGQVVHSGDVAAGASYSGSLTTTLPGVTLGNYHVVVRSDIRNQVVEVSDANNSAASSTVIALNVEALTLGTPDTDSLGQGQAIYYRFDAVAGQAIRLKLNSAQDQSFNELYVRYGDMPTRGQFDLTTDQPFDADPEIVIPIEQTGTYYVLAYGDKVSGAAPYEIVAEEIPFSLTGVKTNVIGNSGESTLEIRGAKFSADTKFELVAANGTVIQAENVLLENSTLAYVTFDLFNEVLGAYDVRAVQAGNTNAVLADVITVETAKGYDLDSNITGPDEVRPNRNYQFDVNYGNTGDIDSIAPLLIIESVNNTKVSTTIDGLAARSSLQLLGISGEGDRGIIRPGDVNTLPIYFNSNTDPIEFNVKSYSADDKTKIDWNSFGALIRPAGLTDIQWNNFLGKIAPRIATYGEYVKMLNKVSSTLSPVSNPIYDVTELFKQLYVQQPNYLPNKIVSGQLLQAQTDAALAQVEVSIYRRSGENLEFSGKAITDQQGKFSISNIDDGEYVWGLTDKAFDQNKDGKIDENAPSLIIPATGDVEGISLYAKDPATLASVVPDSSDPLLFKDSVGTSHLVWKQGGTLYHTYSVDGQWVAAKTLANVLGNNFSVTAAGNLIDGNPGLIATWEEGVGNESDIYYAVGRGKEGGGYQWSAPIRLTNDQVADSAPAISITGAGEAVITYVKRNTEIQDDLDVYYSLIDVNSGELLWTNDTPALAEVEIASDNSPIEPTAQQLAVNWSHTPVSTNFLGLGIKADIQLSGLITQENCEATAGLNGKLKLDLRVPDYGRIEGEGNATLNSYWTVNKQEQNWQFKNAQLDGSAQVSFKWRDGLFKLLNAIPPLAPAATAIRTVTSAVNRWTSLRIENGINIGPLGFEAKDVRWNTEAPFPGFVVPQSVGELSVFFQAGPYLAVTQKGVSDTELSVSGSIGGKLKVYPELKPQFTYNLQLTAKLGGYDLGSQQWGGSIPSSLSLDSDILPYLPESVVGTTNIYSINDLGIAGIVSNGSILANVETDVLRDSAMVMSVDTDGTVFGVWAKDQDPFGEDIGSRLYTTEFNGVNWSSPTVVSDSLGFNDSAAVIVDQNGTRLLVWSYTDTSTLTKSISLNELTSVRDTADLFFVVDTGTGWSAPQKLAPTVGKDRDVTLGKDSNGNIIAGWTYYDGNGGDVLMTAAWSGTQWSTPTQVATGIISNLTIGSVGTQTHLYWNADVNSDPDIETNAIMYSINNPTTGWSNAELFIPVIDQLGISSIGSSTSSSPISTESALFPPFAIPDECKCKEGDPDCDPKKPPKPPYKPPVRRPRDPNDILGPVGFGESRWIDTDESLKYTIRFENATTASAPAQEVVITQQLDADLDWRTFKVDDYGWSGAVYELAGDRAFHRTRIDLTASKGYFVDIAVVIDVTTGLATWKISTIDPATGETPLNAQSGFLPTNNAEGAGEGFVSYSIKAKRTAQTGDIVDATAQIVFDTEEPINTPAIFNTLDVSKPTSQVQPLTATSETPEFLVSWSGTDVGSAIANYTVYVSDNDGAYTPWLTATGLTESTYTGLAGHTYEFYSVATDNAGNSQIIPTEAQATIRVAGGVGSIGDTVWVDSNADGIRDQAELGLANVTVNLYNSASGLIATTTTSATGAYSFTAIATGEYSVGFVAPTGYLFSVANGGTNDTLDSDPNIATGRTDPFTVNAGENLTWDAGLYQLGSISGNSWKDSNGNGAKDLTETVGLAGWNVYLDTNENGLLDIGETNTTTDTNGSYSFLNLRPGNYTVAQVVEPGWIQTYPRIAVSTSAADIPLFVPSLSLESAALTTNAAAVASTTPITSLIDLNGLWQNTQFANIKGAGFSTVIIDTGIDLNHPLFGADADNNGVADRIAYQYDFADNDNDASDRNGHGSHVASIATQIAPDANLIVLKVFKDNLTGSFSYLEKALQWVNQNAATYNIASVNLSLGDSRNWNTTNPRYGIGDEIAAISAQNVIIAAAAGNSFYRLNSVPGVSYPAADTNTIAVGALWSDDFGGPQRFSNGAIDYTTGLDQIASFSQRDANLLDVFAPGVFISGANATGGTQSLGGTSQATPFVSGIAVLAQQIAYEKLGRKLTVNEFRQLLDNTSTIIKDGDNENDNVTNTGLNYSKINLLNLAQGVANFSDSSSGGITNPNTTGGGTSTPSVVDTTILTHAVVLTSGQAVINQDFGSQLINTAPTAIDLVLSINTLEENVSTINHLKVADISITDDGEGTNNLSLSGTDASSFEIIDNQLYLKAGINLNFEGKPSYAVTVEVDDATVGSSPDALANLTLNIIDVNEAPSAITLVNTLASVAENTSITTRLKVANINVTDDAIGTNNLSLIGADAGNFEIVGTELYVKAGSSLNFESNSSYAFQVAVDDATIGNTPDAVTNFTFSITDVNEAPTAITLGNPLTSVAENTSTTTRLKVANINVTDDAIGTNSLSLSGSDASSFEIVGDELYIKAGTTLDFETKSSYAVTVAVNDVTVGSNPDAITTFNLTLTDVNEVTGSINGTNTADNIPGTAGNDTINGLDGNDTIRAGVGNDIISGGNNNDNLYGDEGNDTIDGGSGIDNIYGGFGQDSLIGGLGNDYIDGEDGNDIVEGGYGNDYLYGGNGNDRLLGGSDDDYIDGGLGNDYVDGENGNDNVSGGYGVDTVYGGLGNDTIDGGIGTDVDALFGGAGVDTFVLGKTAADRIGDFAPGELLQISARSFSGGLVANNALQSSQLLVGAGSSTAVTRFIYNNGDLFFDADGSATGFAAVKIATFGSSPSLTASNFSIIR
jgi:Subtilase family/SdrD B-like domain/CARDB/RTX calcium-binding nonapeptide repeat (4 copies)